MNSRDKISLGMPSHRHLASRHKNSGRLLLWLGLLFVGVANALPAAPTGDDFYSPIYIFGATAQQDATTVGATYQAGEPNVSSTGGSIWFRWTPFSKGTAIFDGTFGDLSGKYGHNFEVYSGGSVSALTLLGEDYDTIRSRVTLPVSAFTTYYIRIAAPYSSRVAPVTCAVSFNRDTSEDPVEGGFRTGHYVRSHHAIRAYFNNAERVSQIQVYRTGRVSISNLKFYTSGVIRFTVTKTTRNARGVKAKFSIAGYSVSGKVLGFISKTFRVH